MKFLFPIIFLISSLAIFAAPLQLKDGDTAALVGGTFAEREAKYCLIETYLTLAHSDKNIKFRNLGWSADTVRGESRGYFKISDNYRLLLQKVSETKPSVIILTYGANESWAGEDGLADFIKDYTKLINDFKGKTGARIVLMSTLRQENLGSPYPNPEVHNNNQALYFSEIGKLAKELKLDYIDLFNEFPDVKGLTENSIHLNKKGYHKIAEYLSGFTIKENGVVIEIDVNAAKSSASHGTLNDLKASSDNVTFTYGVEQFSCLMSERTLKVSGLDKGDYEIRSKGRVILKSTADELAKGVKSSKLLVGETLLQTEILEKSEQFFHSWRPQNTTYLIGFRKHEQGNNAKEIAQFAKYISNHEAKINELKKLRSHTWEIVQAKKSVVKKPDGPKLVLPPDEEIKTFNLPDDLEVSLFASEPMIINPTNMNWDTQGRLWVACAPDYPQIKPGHMAGDQIVVLEDTDNDGKADKRHVFVDDVLIPTAVLPGNGGVYVANSTEIIHYKDTDGDMKADVKKIIMSGFGTEDTHHIIHTPYWGQDGMLYFNQSIYIHSHVETPWGVERLMAGGIWQYNPHTERLKVLARGLINSWGHRMNKYGQSFATDGAGSSGINYIFPGIAQRTAYGTRHLYDGLNSGQPKMCGLEIISGSHFPEKYHGLFVTNDFRGHRTNSFKVTENGSAFISRNDIDFMWTGSGKIDRKGSGGGYRPIDVKMGPDGALYVADWSNIIIQHGEVDFRDDRRDKIHGRIWRITAKGRPLAKKPDVTVSSIETLLENLKSEERYVSDMSKRELIERGAEKVLPALDKWLAAGQVEYAELQALWLKTGMNLRDEKLLKKVIAAKDYRIRAAAVRVAALGYYEMPGIIDLFKKTVRDEAPIVRLETVNAARSLNSTEAVEVALQALDSEVDKTIDYALTLTVSSMADKWINKTIFGGNVKYLTYAVNASRDTRALNSLYKAFKDGKIAPENKSNVLRLIGELGDAGQLSELYELTFSKDISAASQKAILDSLLRSSKFRGLRPKGDFSRLGSLIDKPELNDTVIKLTGEWIIKGLTPKLEKFAIEGHAGAISALARIKGPQAEKILIDVINKNKEINVVVKAVASLASVNMKMAVDHSIKLFQNAKKGIDYGPIFDALLQDKKGPDILNSALKGKKINSSVALLGVQRANIGGRNLTELVATLSKAGELKPMKMVLTDDELKAMVKVVSDKGNPHLGENIYRKASIACIACHAIGGAGPKIGPDLISIGASAPVDYLIESLLQPNKKIKEGYHMTMVSTKDGQMIAGTEVSANDEEVEIRNALGKLIKIPARNIKEKKISPLSMMPPGLTASLSEEEFVHLISFLSQLGKDGDFKMSNKRYIRSFTIYDKLPRNFWKNLNKLASRSGYAKVDATIPVKDKTLFPSSSQNLTFDLEVLKDGILTLQFSSVQGLNAFTTSRKGMSIDVANKTASVKVSKGNTGILVMISNKFKAKDLTVEILDSKTTALIKLK